MEWEHLQISPGSMVAEREAVHLRVHSGGGLKYQVFLPLIIACQEGLSTASIYNKISYHQVSLIELDVDNNL